MLVSSHLIYAQLTSYPNNQLVSLHISENLFCVDPSSLVVCPTNFNYLSLAILMFYSQLYKIPVLCLDIFFLAQNSENDPQKEWGEIIIFVSICFSSLRYHSFEYLVAKNVKTDLFLFFSFRCLIQFSNVF